MEKDNRIRNSLKLGAVTAILVSIMELILFLIINAIPDIGHSLAPFILAFSILLSIAAFIFGAAAYYISTIIFKNPVTAFHYALLLALMEFVTSFDPVSTVIAFVGGYASFRIADEMNSLRQPKTNQIYKTGTKERN